MVRVAFCGGQRRYLLGVRLSKERKIRPLDLVQMACEWAVLLSRELSYHESTADVLIKPRGVHSQVSFNLPKRYARNRPGGKRKKLWRMDESAAERTKLALIPDSRLDGFTNLGARSFTIFVLVPALEPFFYFGLLALLSLLFFLALLECLWTTSSHEISFLELHHTLLGLCSLGRFIISAKRLL